MWLCPQPHNRTMTDENKTMSHPIFPGETNQAGRDRIAKAVKALEVNAARCRQILRDILDEMSPGSVSPVLHEDAMELIEEWSDCSAELLDAVSNRNTTN